MPAPDKLRILYEDYDHGRFNYIGRLPDGTQFMAFVTGAYPTGLKYYLGDDWRAKKCWMAVIHRFDADGTHIGSDTRVGGFDIEGREVAGDKAIAQLRDMFGEMVSEGQPEFCDVWVRPFAVEIDGVTHGLFYEHYVEEQGGERYEDEYVMLEPRDIMFHPPWDSGSYST